ncbi:cytochrome C, partial [Pseudomonas sp. FW305-124]
MTETGQGRLRRHLPSAAFVVLAALGVGAVAGGFVYAGVYDIGADTPHSKPIYWMIEQF